MKGSESEIAKRIEDGRYFKDALEWYSHRYLKLASERVFLFFFVIVIGFLVLVTVSNFYSLFPTSGEVPFIIKVDENIDRYTAMKPLLTGTKTKTKTAKAVRGAVAEHLLRDYLIIREEYKNRGYEPDKLKVQHDWVRNLSSRAVYHQFKKFINTQNPESPLLKYQAHSRRQIDILSVTFEEDDDILNKATVRFQASVIRGSEIKKSIWEAVVVFIVSDIDEISQTGLPLKFSVTYYKSRKISDG